MSGVEWRAVEYALDPGEPGDPESLSWGITASWRGPGDAWMLSRGCYMHGGQHCFDRDGNICWNMRPDDDEWRAQHRFTLEEALELGKKFLPNMGVNGMTWAQVVAWRAGGHRRDEQGRPIIPDPADRGSSSLAAVLPALVTALLLVLSVAYREPVRTLVWLTPLALLLLAVVVGCVWLAGRLTARPPMTEHLRDEAAVLIERSK